MEIENFEELLNEISREKLLSEEEQMLVKAVWYPIDEEQGLVVPASIILS